MSLLQQDAGRNVQAGTYEILPWYTYKSSCGVEQEKIDSEDWIDPIAIISSPIK